MNIFVSRSILFTFLAVLLYSLIAPVTNKFEVLPSYCMLLIPAVFACVLVFCFAFRERLSDMIAFAMNKLKVRDVVFLGFVIRLLFVLWAQNRQTSDFRLYDEMAQEMWDNFDFMQPDRPTGASIITAVFYKLFGYSYYSFSFPLVCISTSMIWLTYKTARNLGFNREVCLGAALLVALSVEQIAFTDVVATEVYFSFFALIGFYFIAKGLDRVMNVVLFIFFISLSQYIRSTTPIFVAGFIAYLLFVTNIQWQKKIQTALIAILCYLLFLSPIIYTNYQRYQYFSVSSMPREYANMMIGISLENKGYYNDREVDDFGKEVAKRMSRLVDSTDQYAMLKERRRAYHEMVNEQMNAHFGQIIFNGFVYKTARLWGEPTYTEYSLATKSHNINLLASVLNYLYYKIFLLILAVLGIIRYLYLEDRRKLTGILTLFVLVAVFYTGIHFFLENKPRYHFVFQPLLALLAALICFRQEAPSANITPGVSALPSSINSA